mgnify:CR=1 FL=1
MLAVDLTHISKYYKKEFLTHLSSRSNTPALDNLSLSIPVGETLGIIGPNGSGKSTLLKIILGLVTPNSGQALIFGNPAESIEAKKLTAYIQEEQTFDLNLKASDIIQFFCLLAKIPKSKQKAIIQPQLDAFNLSDVYHQKLRTYSKGMVQRLAIIIATLHQPKLMILDEPTSGMDPSGVKLMYGQLAKLKSQGMTLVICSHDLADLNQICDTTLILHKGKLIFHGGVIDGKTQYGDLIETYHHFIKP